MDRNYEFLLNKYYYRDRRTEKLVKGELWSTEHAVKNMREQRTYDKYNLLEGIINELHGNFIITPQEKKRMRYLVKHLSMDNANLTIKQQIIMIIIYTKLENNQNRQLSDYQSLLRRYDLTTNTFTRFQIGIIQHYIQRFYG